MKQSYRAFLEWTYQHPNAGFWLTVVVVTFLILFILYLTLTIFRLQRHIIHLKRDKRRLMEEKDLIRRGARQPQPRSDDHTSAPPKPEADPPAPEKPEEPSAH